MHPAAGHADGTLLNALLHHVPDIINVPRAGIVHRLDKDTTGLMVVAKTIEAQTRLVDQLQKRSVSRIYECIVIGVITSGGKINAPIGRSSSQRQRMAVSDGGKPAVSHYRVLERYRSHTHARVKLETGRTHQIRVHCAFQKHPVLADLKYQSEASQAAWKSRQVTTLCLHARSIGLIAASGHAVTVLAPIPSHMAVLLVAAGLDPDIF